jgi:NAD-dependent dihydropyrimidine dehydrogenase PreA subunit
MNCPKGLIKVSEDLNIKGVNTAVFRGGKCSGCGMCFVICPDGAIEVIK